MIACRQCSTENPDGHQYCGGCGKALASACPSCGFSNPSGFRFCGSCGTELGEGTSHPTRPTTTEAEHRPLTVVFCDLVDSTGLADELDAETLRDVVRAYQQAGVEAVERYQGHVAQYLGDGMLVYFGYPTAHEDDARRAAHAALEIVDAVKVLSETLGTSLGVRLSARVGIHTGPVVAGEMGSGETREMLAMGQVPNIAARLQGVADADTVVVSAETSRMLHGSFRTDSLGLQTLKGIKHPIEAFHLSGATSARSAFDVARSQGLTSFVGRTDALDGLVEAFSDATRGVRQHVFIFGDAGIGKSRLIQQLGERVGDGSHQRMVVQCSAYHDHSALFPFIDLLQRTLGLEARAPAAQKLDRVAHWVDGLSLDRSVVVPLLAALLSIPLENRYAAPDLTPARLKQRIEDLLATLFEHAARQEPLLLVVEDLHWADPSTLQFLRRFLMKSGAVSLLVVLTARPEFAEQWELAQSIRRIELRRLTEAESRSLIEHVAGGKAMPSDILDEIQRKGDGIPVFIEELTKMVLESDMVSEERDSFEFALPGTELTIPSTLQGSLVARLDRLHTARELAQLGAVLGREFSYPLLREVTAFDDDELDRCLAVLVDAQIFVQDGEPPDASYGFRHALLRDAAYDMLVRRTRRAYHARAAAAMTERFPELAQTQPEIVAYHYTEANETQHAVDYWLRAGTMALERSANPEAVAHLRRGLTLIKDSDERDRVKELTLLRAMGAALIATEGHADPAVEQIYSRAFAVGQEIGDSEQLFWVLRGLWVFHTVGGNLGQAIEFADRMLDLAREGGDVGRAFEAHHAKALPLFFRGRLAESLQNLEAGLALDDPERGRLNTASTGLDIAVTSMAISGVVLWYLGFPDQALTRCEEAVARARTLDHLFSLGDALFSAIWVRQLRGEPDHVHELATELLTLCDEKGFHLAAHGRAELGWALAERSPEDENAIQHLHDGIAAYRATGARTGEVYFLNLLAEAYGRHGEPERGAEVLDGALALLDTFGGDHVWSPELRRLRGELNLADDGADSALVAKEAALAFEDALQTAERFGAASLALRAATSLARLHLAAGRREEAASVLVARYERFAEGLETTDLRTAQALLREIGGLSPDATAG